MSIPNRLKKILDILPYRNWVIGLISVNLLILLAIFFLKRFLPPVVPLFYGKPYGAEQLTTQSSLFLIPLVALFITIINTIINFVIKDEYLQKILVGGMVICTLLASVTLLKIVFLVGSF